MSRSTFRVLFYLKRNSPKKNGMIPVMCRITVNRKVSQFSSKLDVEEKMWNVELGKLTGRSLEAQEGNCLNTLEIIPSMVEQYKEKNKALKRDIPQLQEIVGKVWKKEDELKQLKSELAALDRKIQLELAPPTPDVKQQEEKPDGETHNLPNKTIDI